MNGKTTKHDSKIPVLSPAPLRRTGSLRMGSHYPTIQEQITNTSTRKKISRHHSLVSDLDVHIIITEQPGFSQINCDKYCTEFRKLMIGNLLGTNAIKYLTVW